MSTQKGVNSSKIQVNGMWNESLNLAGVWNLAQAGHLFLEFLGNCYFSDGGGTVQIANFFLQIQIDY